MRYLSIRREIEGSLPTVAELLRQKGKKDAPRAMSQANIEITEVGYDNCSDPAMQSPRLIGRVRRLPARLGRCFQGCVAPSRPR